MKLKKNTSHFSRKYEFTLKIVSIIENRTGRKMSIEDKISIISDFEKSKPW